ncbi:MOSC domain-containing protein [Mariniluteicoccus flavus]
MREEALTPGLRSPSERQRVEELARFPVKGFAPERRSTLTVRDGRAVGDRVLGLRYADAEADDGWGTKRDMVVLMNTPAIARLSLTYAGGRVRLARGGEVLADVPLDDAGRAEVARVAAQQPELNLAPGSRHLPLRLVGDGVTPQLQDRRAGYVSLHSRASLERLADALGAPGLDGARFRSNVVIDGIEPLAELGWAGRRLTIGGVRFRVHQPLVRCLATHANPTTGERDLAIMKALTRDLGLAEPVFGVSLVALDDGEIAVGDEVTLG